MVEAPVEAVVEAARGEAVEAPAVEEIAPIVEAATPLQSFEVTEHAPTEMTLEKVMEQALDEQLIQPVVVEEAHITTHPLEAPQAAPSEVEAADNDQTPQAEESDESTTTE